jgi:hypothetical protein
MTSAIDPNNIVGNYPVANQPNNTQGFRDNFTNTKTNFEYAASEITDLQSKAVLKAALTGGTLDNNMNNQLIYAALIQDFSATAVAITATSGSIAVDYSAGHYQTIVPTGSISLSFTNFPVAGQAGLIRLRLTIASVAYTVTLPSAVSVGTTGIQGLSASTITFGATGTYEFDFETVDGGTTITIFDLNRPLSYYTNPVIVADASISTSISTGAFVVSGGAGVVGNLYVGGNIVGNLVVTNQTFTGNLSGGNLLTGGVVSATSNITGGNIRTAGQVSATGNVSGNYFIGNGSQLTGIVVSAGSSIVNGTSNVVVAANGNVSVGVAGTASVVRWANTGEYVTGVVSVTGNVNGGNVLTAGQVSATGNVAGGNVLTAGQVSATGNVAGNYVLGNGTFLTGITTSTQISSGTTQLAVEVPSGNIQATIGGTANVVVFRPTGAYISGVVSATGNINGSNILGTGLISATGNITGGNLNAAGNVTSGNIAVTGNISLTGNVIGGNLTTGTQVVATGNITGGNIKTDGQMLAMSNTAPTAGGVAAYLMSSTANLGVFFGSGVPTISAAQGSLYMRTDGSSTSTRMYVNTNGTTGWTAVTTAS